MGTAGGDALGGEDLATRAFLFTDIEGSTRRWRNDPAGMEAMLAAHDRCLRRTVEAHHGRVFKHTGDGVCAVFESVREAVAAGVQAQRELELPVRMAVHVGDAVERSGDYFGVTLSACARLMDAAHGGQLLLSAAAASLLEERFELRDLGEHRLRDLGEPQRILQALSPGLRVDFPALRTLDTVRHNLPVLRSSFVGREPELNDVRRRLTEGQLVTLTGIGGCGKTRLALEAALGLTDQFTYGVFFVDLAPVSDPDLVGQAVMSALGLHLGDASDTSLGSYLADRRVLIVLDNCEHLLDACAALADSLLEQATGLRILATSREPLGLDGEQVFRVPSLRLETDAVRLFLDRSEAAGVRLETDGARSRDVVEICRRLDGIPLAIELAAARTTHLDTGQILERLSDRFRLLTGGRRRVQRQQTLAAAIAWSHDLLGEAEQTLFRRLAVFRGSFSLEAAEQICHADALDLLGSLVEKSLVDRSVHPGAHRFRMLETVRAYAEERLVASGEAARLRDTHRDWLVGWIESLFVDELFAYDEASPVPIEADNLQAALDWSLEQDRLELVARIASRMIHFWFPFGRVEELSRWWQTLRGGIDRLPPELKPHALIVGAQQAMTVGEFQHGAELGEQVVSLAPADSWLTAYAWSLQALYWTYADPERGRLCIQEGRRAAIAARSPAIEAWTASLMANLLTGDPERDEEIGGQEIIDELLSSYDEAKLSTSYYFLGIVAALGDPATAKRLGDFERHTIPTQRFSQQFLAAIIALRERRPEAASEYLRAAVSTVREHAIPLAEAACLTGFAAVQAERGDYERASRLLACVRAVTSGVSRTPADGLLYRQTVRSLKGQLDRDTAARCRAEGAATPISQALDTELTALDTDRRAAGSMTRATTRLSDRHD